MRSGNISPAAAANTTPAARCCTPAWKPLLGRRTTVTNAPITTAASGKSVYRIACISDHLLRLHRGGTATRFNLQGHMIDPERSCSVFVASWKKRSRSSGAPTVSIPEGVAFRDIGHFDFQRPRVPLCVLIRPIPARPLAKGLAIYRNCRSNRRRKSPRAPSTPGARRLDRQSCGRPR